MRNTFKTPEVNAGSMADIGFLLLIFFLVTTTIANDKGIARKLPPPCPPGEKCDVELNERNVLRININETGEIMVNKNIVEIDNLRILIKDFIDNNGDASCNFCSGKGLATASDNPREASISLTTHRNTPYKSFITVQDEITAAYLELRRTYISAVFKKEEKLLTQQEMQQVREAYPLHISEASIRQ